MGEGEWMKTRKGWGIGLLAAAIWCGQPARGQEVNFHTLPAMQITTPIPGSGHAPQDVNGDGLSDLLWFNESASKLEYWTMENTAGWIRVTGRKTFSITPGYVVGAVGDTNGDGLADLVWTSARHDLYLWLNAGNGGFRSVYYGAYPAGWQLFGAGDVNGDGRDDLLWLNPSTCQFAYWTMDGARRTGYRIIPYACGYYPIAIGYFSPGNRVSVMWTSAGRDLWVWDGAGKGFASSSLGRMPTPYDPPRILAAGGGRQGKEMIFQAANAGSSEQYAYRLDRSFDANGRQTAYEYTYLFFGGAFPDYGTASFMVESRDVNNAAMIYENRQNAWISFCPPEDGTAQWTCYGGTLHLYEYWPDAQNWAPIGGTVNRVPPLVLP